MNKAKLSKIHKAKTQVWLELWQKFAEFREYMPQAARVYLEASYYEETNKKLAALTQAETEQLEAQHKQITIELCQAHELDPQAWFDWSTSFETAISSFDPDKPDLKLSPFNLPSPPTCPVEVLRRSHELDFSAGLDGIPKLSFVYYLALAQRVCDFKELE